MLINGPNISIMYADGTVSIDETEEYCQCILTKVTEKFSPRGCR